MALAAVCHVHGFIIYSSYITWTSHMTWKCHMTGKYHVTWKCHVTADNSLPLQTSQEGNVQDSMQPMALMSYLKFLSFWHSYWYCCLQAHWLQWILHGSISARQKSQKVNFSTLQMHCTVYHSTCGVDKDSASVIRTRRTSLHQHAGRDNFAWQCTSYHNIDYYGISLSCKIMVAPSAVFHWNHPKFSGCNISQVWKHVQTVLGYGHFQHLCCNLRYLMSTMKSAQGATFGALQYCCIEHTYTMRVPTSLSSDASSLKLPGLIMNSLVLSALGCGAGSSGAYVSLRMARRTEFLGSKRKVQSWILAGSCDRFLSMCQLIHLRSWFHCVSLNPVTMCRQYHICSANHTGWWQTSFNTFAINNKSQSMSSSIYLFTVCSSLSKKHTFHQNTNLGSSKSNLWHSGKWLHYWRVFWRHQWQGLHYWVFWRHLWQG